MIPKVGDKIKFRPAANADKTNGFAEILGQKVPGEIVEVNFSRRWARARYVVAGVTRYGCFKF